MSVDYTQIFYIGIELHTDKLMFENVPDTYEYQPRYNTKTGQKTHDEKVLVKEGYQRYKFKDLEIDSRVSCLDELAEYISEEYDLDVYYSYEDDTILVGKDMASDIDCFDKVHLLETKLSISDINKIINELKNKLPEEYHNDIMLYFRKSIC